MSKEIVVDSVKIVELRNAGYTWNQIDELLLKPEEIVRKNDKIVSRCFKIAKKRGLEGAFTKVVIGAYTPTQIVIPIRKFTPHAIPAVPQQVEMFI